MATKTLSARAISLIDSPFSRRARVGRQNVGKADGADSICQRWSAYATNGHGGNIELRALDPIGFRFSLLRVFDPATPTRVIDEAESHFKIELDTRSHGLNRN